MNLDMLGLSAHMQGSIGFCLILRTSSIIFSYLLVLVNELKLLRKYDHKLSYQLTIMTSNNCSDRIAVRSVNESCMRKYFNFIVM